MPLLNGLSLYLCPTGLLFRPGSSQNVIACFSPGVCAQTHTHIHGLPGRLSDKESAGQCRRLELYLWVEKTPWSWKWQPTPVFLPGQSYERSLASYSPWDCKRVGHNWTTKQQTFIHSLTPSHTHTHTLTHSHSHTHHLFLPPCFCSCSSPNIDTFHMLFCL